VPHVRSVSPPRSSNAACGFPVGEIFLTAAQDVRLISFRVRALAPARGEGHHGIRLDIPPLYHHIKNVYVQDWGIVMKRQRLLPGHCEPFAVCHEEAAALWGVGTTTFNKLVAERVIPKPVRVGGRVLWDLAALKRAWKRFTDEHGEPEHNPWDQLLKDDNGRIAQIRPAKAQQAR
jgi:predicted DNA-binding transcriptional regulator AlpA